jgi:TIR domain
MSYEWDVFLSYNRRGSWPRFVDGLFYERFVHWLGESLEYEPEIFHDVKILEAGYDWPPTLAGALATSKAFVGLWSGQYFSSPWCKAELGQILAREKRCGIPSSPVHGRLIVPAALSGTDDDIPLELRAIQYVSLRTLSSPWISEGTPTGELLSDRIRDWVPAVKDAILRAPEWSPEWVDLAIDEFEHLFRDQQQQTTVPSLGSSP